ncbi:MAG: hypothetical protein LBK03_07755 [Bacteroidales bacterium]|jgi:hypothetical protein|nr:hypothetical protein [Bacteroidales bacterium]
MKTPMLWLLLLLAVKMPLANTENLPEKRKWRNEMPLISLYFLQQNNDAQQAFANQSFIAAGVRNDFLLKELMSEQLTAQWAYKSNRFLLSVAHEGISQYGTMQFSTGYAKLFAQKLAIATRFYYILHHAERYPSVHSLSFDMSFQAAITPKMGLAVQVSNPAYLKYGITGDVPLPMRFLADFYYKAGDKTLVTANMEYILNGSFNLSLQLMQQIQALHLSFAVSLHHTSLSAGLTMKQFIIQLHTAYDWRLGISSEFTAIFLWNKSERIKK